MIPIDDGCSSGPVAACRCLSERSSPMSYEFSKIEDALQALAEGRVVIVVDDESRENEGDFVAAAERVTPETIEFMITHGRGQLCMPIMPELAKRLELHPMVETNTAPDRTLVHRARSTTSRAGPASAPRSGPGRSGRSSTRRPGPATWSGPATSRPWSPRRGASSAAPGTPRRRSTWPAWRVSRRPGCSARSSTGPAWPAASGCTRSPPSSTCRSSRSRC